MFEKARLFSACKGGDSKGIENILKSSSKIPIIINSQNSKGLTGLMVASLYGNFEVCNTLIEKGADVNFKNNIGLNPLWLGLFISEDFKICKLLIEKGADIDSKNLFEQTPLIYATFLKSQEKVKFLIENGADINAVDSNGISATKLASISDSIDIFGDLALAKADLSFLKTESVVDSIRIAAKVKQTITFSETFQKELDNCR